MLTPSHESRRPYVIWMCGLVVALVMVRSMFVPGVIGYVDDWNVPSTPHGLFVWGIADFSPWRAIEYGLPTTFPTDFYLKLGLGLAGLTGIPTGTIVALFLTLCFTVGFAGVAHFCRVLWRVSDVRAMTAGLLYVASPVAFDALVPGYLTFILSYAMLPWLAISLVSAVQGRPFAWYRYALFWALSLSQIQFAIFDAIVSVALLAGLQAPIRAWLRAALSGFAGGVLTYSFIVVNLAGVVTLVSSATRWSQHSWTSLSAPGIGNAAMLVPSVYPYFDLSLGVFSVLWRALAVLWVVYVVFLAFTVRRPLPVAIAIVLAVCLLFLHGPNPPLTAPMTWLLSSGPMAILRNVNYVFALVAFALSVLVVVPTSASGESRAITAALLIFSILWAAPFLVNTYTAFISPIPGKNVATAIVGEDARTLVFPHLQVIDNRRPGTGGVNPNSVETITPIFVRDTPTGILHASLLDRLTDWTPGADTFAAALRTARVNAVALQTGLGSTFPLYVYATHDLWLRDSYLTSSFRERLDAVKSLTATFDGSTALYRAPEVATDVQTAGSAVAVSGSVESEIAMRAIGFNSLFVPAEILDRGSSWVHGLVRTIGAPELIASPADLKDGSFVAAGEFTDRATANFHDDWADPMATSNWWFDQRLLAEPHAAMTDFWGGTLNVPVPHGRRHVLLEYYASRFGGTLTFGGRVQKRAISAYGATLGEYRWIDLGVTKPGDAPLTILSDKGFNAVGNIFMLTDAQERADRKRFDELTAGGRVDISPNVTFGETLHFTVSQNGWHPSMLLANLSQPVKFDLQARVQRRGSICDVQVGRAALRGFTVLLDGAAPNASRGDFFTVAKTGCLRRDAVTLNGISLTPEPRTLHLDRFDPMLQIGSGAGANGPAPVNLRFLPLSFGPIGRGAHTLAISDPKAFLQIGSRWSPAKYVKTTDGRVDISLASKVPISVSTYPNATVRGEHMLLTGSYRVRPLSIGRLMFYNGNVEAKEDFPGDGAPRQFHWDLASVPRTRGDSFQVGLDSQNVTGAFFWVSLSPAVPAISANVILMEPRFHVDPEQQLAPQDHKFLRYAVDRPQKVLQYDQTFDPGWEVRGSLSHIESTSGFNLWVMGHPQKSTIIAYRTGIAYGVAVIVSVALFLFFTIMSLRRYDPV